MEKLNIKRASISALIIWVIGVSAFVGSYSLPIMEDADEQANWALTIGLIPAIAIGLMFYRKKGMHTNAFKLGSYMFLITILLDALITVPLFIIPAGGNHLSFFGDPGFWILGLEYVGLVVFADWFLNRKRFKLQA